MCNLTFVKDVFVSYIEDAIYRDKLNTIINHFGKTRQMLKLSGETGELIEAYLRYDMGIYPTNQRVTEEFADVLLVLLQVMLINNIDPNDIIKILESKPDKTITKYNIKGGDYMEDEAQYN